MNVHSRPCPFSNHPAMLAGFAAAWLALVCQTVAAEPARDRDSGSGDVPSDVRWDLASDEIPEALRVGNVEKVDGTVRLRDGAAFAVPAEAFPDQRNFTVQVTASLDELVQDALFTAMNKQGAGDDGFAFFMNHRDAPAHARKTSSLVNKILMQAPAINGSRGPQPKTPYTFTLCVREGLATFYVDDLPFKTCFMELIPNVLPMWIGRNPDPRSKTMPVTIHGVKVFGPSYRYASKKERPTAFPRGAVAGKGWAIDVPKIEHADWPQVLVYGDSISGGYIGSFIPRLLDHHAYVFHCVHFVGGDVPEQPITEMAGRFPFDVVVFNNGLHSLHWTPDSVSDDVVRQRMRTLARCFKRAAPRAKLFYLTTTPHTAARPASDEPVSSLGDKNDVVIRLNRLSGEVMQEEGVEVIDVYPVLAARLDLANGDGYHWKDPAYTLITDLVTSQIAPFLHAKPPRGTAP